MHLMRNESFAALKYHKAWYNTNAFNSQRTYLKGFVALTDHKAW